MEKNQTRGIGRVWVRGGSRRWSFGANSGGLGDGSPPVGSRGEAPAGGLGDSVPQKLEHLKIHNLNFKAL